MGTRCSRFLADASTFAPVSFPLTRTTYPYPLDIIHVVSDTTLPVFQFRVFIVAELLASLWKLEQTCI